MGNFMFNNCSKKTAQALQFFCDNVNHCDGDIFVVMAQKALCLYELLSNLNLIKKKNVYSSTSIDFNRNMLDWSDKRVVILEDIIVSGSALSAATNRLKNFGVNSSNLKIIAIARDEEYHSMKFSNEETNENILVCGMNCTDADCIEISYDISRLLSYYGMPYDADYPSYPQISLNGNLKKIFFHSPLWDTYDVSNVESTKNRISIFTLFPTNITKSKLWEIIGINLDTHIHLKCRAYFDNNNNKLTIVPMALLNEIKHNDLLVLYDHLKEKFYPSFDIDRSWSLKTKFRFVQYYIAHKLASIIFGELTKKKDLFPRKEWLNVQFGPIYNEIYDAIIRDGNFNACFLEKNFEVLEPNTFLFEISNSNKLNKEYSQVEVNEMLLSPFKERHFKAEIPTRERIKKLNAHFIKDYSKIEAYSNRLRKGFSLNALLKIFATALEDFDYIKIISLFLDRAIDLGIVVPVTYHNHSKGYICRAYRHGEDLPFGEADKYRVVYFLRCIKDYLWLYGADNKAATITLEKMIVLFLQMGLNHGEVFNRFLGFENYPVLKERFCIHGAIATFFDDESKKNDDHIYSEMETSTWITTWLRREGLISKIEDADGFHYILNEANINKYITENDCGNLSRDITIVIENIADTITRWYSLKNNKKEFKEDITAMTSCYNKYTFASAIITEIHFFKRYWNKQVKDNFEIICSDSWNRDNNSFRYSDIEQGLNSGRDKYIWYINGRAQQVVKNVTIQLKSSRNPNFSLWKKCTSDIIETSTIEIDETLAEALGYLYFYSSFYEWLVKGNLLQSDKAQNFLNENSNAANYYEQFKGFAKISRKLNTNLFSVFRDASNISNVYDRINMLERFMSRTLEYSEALIEKIEKDISKNAKSFTVYYESCFIIDIKTRKNLNSVLMDLWLSLEENICKTDLNIIDFGVVDNSYQRFGIFYAKRIDNKTITDSYLFKVFEKLRLVLLEKAYITRCVFIPSIPHQVIMMHNTLEHIEKYKESFSSSFLNHITTHFNNQYLHQMIIVEVGNNNYWGVDKIKEFYSREESIGQINGIIIPDSIYAKLLYSYDERKDFDRCDYSTVGIFNSGDENAEILGTGFLVRNQEDIFCVTCQHLFKSFDLKTPYIKLKNSKTKYMANFLNRHDKETGQHCSSVDDVLVLTVELNALSKIDRDKIFSNDTIIPINLANKTIFKMFGYSSITGAILQSIKFIGICDNDYYLLQTEEKIRKGFSGASVVSKKEELLGMHSAHTNSDMFVIPAEQIFNEIKKIKEKKE